MGAKKKIDFYLASRRKSAEVENPMPMEKSKIRVDLKVEEFQWIDKEKGLFRTRMVPDPARYEKHTLNGEEGYLDKSDGSFLSTKIVAQAARQMAGLPIYAPRPAITSLPQYFAEARKRISESLV